MPNIKSAAKRVRSNKKRTSRNRFIKGRIKSALKDFQKTVTQTEDSSEAKEKLVNACKELDKAASKGVIHKNKASRKKSQLQHHFNENF